jgi:hypothetical protein
MEKKQKKLTAAQKKEVTFAKEELARFKSIAKSPDIADESTKREYPSAISLNNFFPTPEALMMRGGPHGEMEWHKLTEEQRKKQDAWAKIQKKKNIKEYKNADWYSWRIDNWGTKWDIEASLEQEDDELIEYQFDSAWSPPVPWMDVVSKKFPRLKFQMKYEEPGMCFMGNASAKDGVYNDDCIDYSD